MSAQARRHIRTVPQTYRKRHAPDDPSSVRRPGRQAGPPQVDVAHEQVIAQLMAAIPSMSVGRPETVWICVKEPSQPTRKTSTEPAAPPWT